MRPCSAGSFESIDQQSIKVDTNHHSCEHPQREKSAPGDDGDEAGGVGEVLCISLSFVREGEEGEEDESVRGFGTADDPYQLGGAQHTFVRLPEAEDREDCEGCGEEPTKDVSNRAH